jgi:hypothetical protein
MSSGVIVFLELALVLGFALFFGIREIRNLKRYDRERAEKAARGDAGPPDSAGPGS